MPKVNFSAIVNGFHFANYFVNAVAELPGIGKISTAGRCGGMSYAALDHYFAQCQMPSQTSDDFNQTHGVPPDGNVLADYIMQRQLDSFKVLSAAKFISLSLTPDKSGWFRKGVSRLTKREEFTKLAASIDRGVPVTIGLITARDVAHLGSNHQVVAYGYDRDEASGAQIVYIYDVNYADREMQLRSTSDQMDWSEADANGQSIGIQWRGWFVQDYSPKPPVAGLAEVRDGVRDYNTLAVSASRLISLTVTLERITFSNDDDESATDSIALDFNIGGQMMRWPANGLETIEHGKAYPLNNHFKLRVSDGGKLIISVRPAHSDAHLDAIASGALDQRTLDSGDDMAGVIADSYTADVAWGAGEHTRRSRDGSGVYTLVYSIDVQ